MHGFALERQPDEAEGDFFIRAVAAAEAANLDWIAFTKPVDLWPSHRCDDEEALALEEAPP